MEGTRRVGYELRRHHDTHGIRQNDEHTESKAHLDDKVDENCLCKHEAIKESFPSTTYRHEKSPAKTDRQVSFLSFASWIYRPLTLPTQKKTFIITHA